MIPKFTRPPMRHPIPGTNLVVRFDSHADLSAVQSLDDRARVERELQRVPVPRILKSAEPAS